MYTFIRTKPFASLSSLYEVYDGENKYVTTMVVGFCNLNKIYFFTEYKGTSRPESIDYTDEFCAILYDFSQFFELLEPTDIISDNYKYLTYRDEMPPIELKYLYLYDNWGEVSRERDGDWIIVPGENLLEDLVYCKALNGSQILLEDYPEDSNELFVDLNEDAFYCNGDEVEGFFMGINDWNEIHRRAESYKIHSF